MFNISRHTRSRFTHLQIAPDTNSSTSSSALASAVGATLSHQLPRLNESGTEGAESDVTPITSGGGSRLQANSVSGC